MRIDTERITKVVAEMIGCGLVIALIFAAGVDFGRNRHSAKPQQNIEIRMISGWPAKIDRERGTIEFLQVKTPPDNFKSAAAYLDERKPAIGSDFEPIREPTPH